MRHLKGDGGAASRREFVGTLGAGLGLLLAGSVRGGEPAGESVLKQGDKPELDRPGCVWPNLKCPHSGLPAIVPQPRLACIA